MMPSTRKIDHPAAVDWPVGSEGRRNPAALSTGQAPPARPAFTAVPAPKIGPRERRPPLFKLEQWRQKAEAALDDALKEREAAPADGQLAAAMHGLPSRIGELDMENELFRSRMERPGPLARRRSR
jgi:hypothetical protein